MHIIRMLTRSTSIDDMITNHKTIGANKEENPCLGTGTNLL